MTAEDINAVYAIERDVTPNPWTKFIFRGCLERYNSWVMRQQDEVIGFGILMLAGEESHILNLAVAKKYQGQGYGRKMLEHLLKEARIAKANSIFLEVRSSNDPALSLYKNLGFKPIGMRKDYYQTALGREDAQLFHKTL